MAAERLIDLPEERGVAPDWVFDRLREIDPDLEVVCVSPGYWWVGAVKPLAPRCKAGLEALRLMEKNGFEKSDPGAWPMIRNAILKSQGFGLIGKYRFNGGNEDWGGIIEEIRFADYMHRKYEDGSPEIRAQIDGAADEDKMLQASAKFVKDRYEDQRYLFKKLFRNTKSFAVGATVT